jgi:integrase
MARWSYLTGDKGRNRVRAFEDGKSIFLEWTETVGGRSRKRRKSLGHSDRREAQQEAQEWAAGLGREAVVAETHSAEPTLKQLFDIYGREKTPDKCDGKQKHDRRAAKMFVAFFGADKRPSTLKKRDGERFIRDRREGRTGPVGKQSKPVGNRQVEYDLRFLKAVLNWAADNELLQRNPLQGLKPPKEASPKRPTVSRAEYLSLLEASEDMDWRYGLALVLGYETGHRIGAIRTLRWSDVDFEAGRIRWRAENDKQGWEHVTPLSDGALRALKDAQQARMAIGDAWIFPSPKDPTEPCSRHIMRDWWKRGTEAAELAPVAGRGWHSLRRRFATDHAATPLKNLSALGGWKSPQVILMCYQSADEEVMRQALATRTAAQS